MLGMFCNITFLFHVPVVLNRAIESENLEFVTVPTDQYRATRLKQMISSIAYETY